MLGAYQGDGISCANVTCDVGVVNDDCADALPLALGDTPFTTLGATTDGPTEADACGGSFTFGQDIWYTFAAVADGTLEVSTCQQADFDTKLAAYAGGCADLALVACDDDACPGLTSILTVPMACGESVLIRVGGFSTQSGTGTLTTTFAGAPCSSCEGDTDDSGAVDVTDLVNVITAWGTSGRGEGYDADQNDDGLVDVLDLVLVITNWGACG